MTEPPRVRRQALRSLAIAACVSIVLAPRLAPAQLPGTRLDGLFPAGAAPGSTVELTIFGNDLDDVDRLHFSHEGIKAERKMAEPTPFDDGPQSVPNVFLVTVAGNVAPGTYEIRCQGKYGLSNPRTFVVGALPEFIELEPNGEGNLPPWTETEAGRVNPANEVVLPVTINGQSSGGPDVDWFRFAGRQGERVLLEGHAARIDSRMEMVVTLYSEVGVILGEGRGGAASDPLVDVTLPADGSYFVKVHDTIYGQGPGYHYRLSIGVLPYLDFVFPPAGLPGSNDEYTLYGRNLPGGQPSGLVRDGRPLEQLKVRIPIPGDVADKLSYRGRLDPHQAGLDGIEYRITAGNVASNPVLISRATAPPVMEAPNNDAPDAAQKLTPPCEVMGQFYPRRDVDWFEFDAKQGEIWAIDLYSHRLGLPTDPALLVQRVVVAENGEKQVSTIALIDDLQEQNFNNQAGRHEFDERTSDPSYLFTAPADGAYRILVKEGYSAIKTDPRLVYRLAIRKPQPDFRIVAVPGDSTGSLMLRKGGRDVFRVFVFRQDGFTGEIRVNVAGLPQGVTSEAIIIGGANRMGTLILTAAPDAPPSIGTLQVTAKGTIEGQEVSRNARYGAALMPFQFNQPNAMVPSVPARTVDRVQICVSDQEVAPALLTIGNGQPFETPRGGILKIPYQLKLEQGAAGNLIGFPIDFPPNTNAQQVGIGTNASGEFELRFQANTPPGKYSFYLSGFHQGVTYRRNPEAAERAKARQERVGKILETAQQTTQQMQQNAQAKQNELNQANAALSQANQAKQTADQGAVNAENALKAAQENLKQKQEQSAANPNDENLKQQVAAAQTQVTEAEQKLKDAQTLAADALKKQEEADAAQKAVQEAKTKADADLQAAQQFQQQAQQEKQRADQFYNQTQNEANPRGFNAIVPSNTVMVTIVDFPLTVETLSESVSVKQGEKVEVPVKLNRTHGFTGNVNVQTQLPGGVNGVGIQNINVPDNQPEGKFEITAQPTATVGEHVCTVRLQMNFNGQNLVMERALKLTVVEVKTETN